MENRVEVLRCYHDGLSKQFVSWTSVDTPTFLVPNYIHGTGSGPPAVSLAQPIASAADDHGFGHQSDVEMPPQAAPQESKSRPSARNFRAGPQLRRKKITLEDFRGGRTCTLSHVSGTHVVQSGLLPAGVRLVRQSAWGCFLTRRVACAQLRGARGAVRGGNRTQRRAVCKLAACGACSAVVFCI